MTERQKIGYFALAILPLCIVALLSFTHLLRYNTGVLVPADRAVRAELEKINGDFATLCRLLDAQATQSENGQSTWSLGSVNLTPLVQAVRAKEFPATVLDPEVLETLHHDLQASTATSNPFDQFAKTEDLVHKIARGESTNTDIDQDGSTIHAKIFRAFRDKFVSVLNRRNEILSTQPMVSETRLYQPLVTLLYVLGIVIPALYFLAVWGNGSVFLESVALAYQNSRSQQMTHVVRAETGNERLPSIKAEDSHADALRLSPTNAGDLQRRFQRKTPFGRWMDKKTRLAANNDTREVIASDTEVIKAQGEQILTVAKLQNDIDDQQDYAAIRPLRQTTTQAKEKADAEEHNLRRAEAIQKKKDLSKKDERPLKPQKTQTPIEQVRSLEAQLNKDLADLEQSALTEETRTRIRETLQQAFEDKVERIINKQSHGQQ